MGALLSIILSSILPFLSSQAFNPPSPPTNLPPLQPFSGISRLFDRQNPTQEELKNQKLKRKYGVMSKADASFEATVMDVLIARAILQKKLELPAEIIDLIWEYAEYWPHTTTELDFSTNGGFSVRSGQFENRLLLRTRPLGFIKVPHPRPKEYATTAAEPRRLSKEHTLQDYQKWVKSPVDMLEHPCRKIVFTIASKDQGWGGDNGTQGTYDSAYSWFDVGLERFDAENTCEENCPDADGHDSPTQGHLPTLPICSLRPIIPSIERSNPYDEDDRTMRYRFDGNPSDTRLQSNLIANKDYREHCIAWNWTDSIDPDSEAALELEKQGRGKATANGEFVRSLKPGDVITLWAKARYPGWVNNVQRVKVDVYWAF